MNSLQHLASAPGTNGARSGELRILYPVRGRAGWPHTASESERVRRICVLDTETTGLRIEKHQIIELCGAVVLVDDRGRVVAVEQVKTGLVDPGHPLPPEITELTGLSDADLAGKSICPEQLAGFVGDCDGVIAFNAGFDRPFVEKHVGRHVAVPWGCAMQDVQWRKLGFEPGPQGYLLAQAGYYMPSAHRARDDVLALIELLDHVCADGESVMAKVLAAIEEPAFRFEAWGAPYAFKGELKDRRYRWAPERAHKIWHKHVRQADFRSEYRWYRQMIGKRPMVVPLPATERYRANETWSPKRPKVSVPEFLR